MSPFYNATCCLLKQNFIFILKWKPVVHWKPSLILELDKGIPQLWCKARPFDQWLHNCSPTSWLMERSLDLLTTLVCISTVQSCLYLFFVWLISPSRAPGGVDLTAVVSTAGALTSGEMNDRNTYCVMNVMAGPSNTRIGSLFFICCNYRGVGQNLRTIFVDG